MPRLFKCFIAAFSSSFFPPKKTTDAREASAVHPNETTIFITVLYTPQTIVQSIGDLPNLPAAIT
jgi:hypothetical protein